jgi:hypothetical protein
MSSLFTFWCLRAGFAIANAILTPPIVCSSRMHHERPARSGQQDQQMLKELYNACPARHDKFGSHVIGIFCIFHYLKITEIVVRMKGILRAPGLLEN